MDFSMNVIDVVILCVLGISVIFGMHRGFISGLLSLAALFGSFVFSFVSCGQLASWLNSNEALRSTLLYYMDAGSRIAGLDEAQLKVSELTQNALEKILETANLPSAFETVFASAIKKATGDVNVSTLLSETIIGVSVTILSFLICFFISYLMLTIFIHLIDYVFELPVLRHLDSLAGGIFGLVRGWILIVIFFMIVPIVQSVMPLETLQGLMDGSKLVPYFNTRLILSLLGIMN